MNVTKQLILDHFDRKASPLQAERIAEWVRDEANEEQYYAWLEEWERNNLQYEAPTDPAMNRYLQFVDTHPHTESVPVAAIALSKTGTQRLAWSHWLAVAAALVLVLGLGGWLFWDQLAYKTYQTAYGEVKTFGLPDGSTVKLNTNSQLRVPRWTFDRESRDVFLVGEASFSVAHMVDNRRFIVRTPTNVEVVVLGTEFTLYAREHNSRVVLERGKVQVRYRQNDRKKEIMMKPGDLVTLDRDNRARLRTTKQAKQYAEWEEKRFVFEETTLNALAYQLHDEYGLDVEIKGDELGQREFMGSFKARDVDELLLSLSELLDITVTRQGKHVQFSDK